MTPTAALAAVASALMVTAAARPWGLGFLALVAYVPALLALIALERARHGAAVAAVASLGSGAVAYEAARGLFAGGHAAATLLAAVPFALVGALAVRLRRALAARLGPRRAAALTLLALPSAWTAAEWLPSRPELLGAYVLPLGFVGYTQLDLPTAQVARLGSVAAVSHLVLAANACLALVCLAFRGAVVRRGVAAGLPRWHAVPGRALALGAGIAVVVAAATLAARPWASAALPPRAAAAAPAHAGPDEGPGIAVALVQPGLPDAAYFAAAELAGARTRLTSRLGSLVPAGVDLAVLPEAAWPGPVDARALTTVAAEVAAAFVGDGAVMFGAPAVGFEERAVPAAGAGRGARTNSVFLYAGGALAHVHAKRRLVPIGESGLVAGPAPAVVTVAGVPLAPLVCYEALFPSDARQAVLAGARLLVVVTDDAFAAASDVPTLHLAAARMRAIETGVPVLLAANTGPSAVVDPAGRVTAHLPALQAGALTARVRPGRAATPYVALGEWFGATTAVLTGGLAAIATRGGGAYKGPA